MVNPATIKKLMQARNTFSANHPKFSAFFGSIFGSGIPEGTILEITVTKPGQESVTTNMKVQQSDIDLFQGLQELAK
ncbi:MAG: hypothetical protein LIO96_07065 [Lachnospiraceae bacterium]|nr:hypothetical protein [Lachnospiraceae bacterium]